MGLLDKVKESAEKARYEAQVLKERLEERAHDIQEEQKAEALIGVLGRFLYAERTGRAVPGADAEIDRLVEQLKSLESAGTTILPPSPGASPAPESPAAAPPPAPPPPV
ncbi:MAG TPA: hypothetical protein VHT75_10405 [Acidimicrobiales bacterium]|jgi:hypothetical protein|nr:hypothetical protein [Acidimicrobiales bacterium]